MLRVAQLLEDRGGVECADLNCSCPIDLIRDNGAGVGLMKRPRQLELIVRGMSDLLTCPLTLKVRKVRC